MAATGIILRRLDNKNDFQGVNSLVDGELVFSLTSNEFGFLKDGGDTSNITWGRLENELPTGGTTGQLLAKSLNNDYVVEWIDAPEGGGGSQWINTSVKAVLAKSSVGATTILTYPHNNVETTISYSIATQVIFDNTASWDFLSFSGAIIVPSDLIDGDIIDRPGLLSGFNEQINPLDGNYNFAQRIQIRKIAGSIEFRITNNNSTNEMWHSANTLVIQSTTGITKNSYGNLGG